MKMNNPGTKAMALTVLAAGAFCLLGSGCSGEDATPVAQAPIAPPPPPPPPAPRVTPVEQLMAELNIDPRVTMAEERAPDNNTDRKAVLVFFDAVARGNANSLKGMLTLTDQIELDALVESGDWEATASKIKRVDIQTGANALNQKCSLAVIEVGAGSSMTFQPQLWYYTTEQESPLFEAAATPPGIMDQLTGNWITTWHQILADELAMANEPDEDLILVQKDLTPNDESSGSGPSASGGGGGDGGGALGGGPRRNPGPKKAAPGPGQ